MISADQVAGGNISDFFYAKIFKIQNYLCYQTLLEAK
jgi:hypothetical protein